MTARSWTLVLLLWGTVVAAAVPGALWMRSAMADQVGRSRVHMELRERMDMVWLADFQKRAGEAGETLTPPTTSSVDLLHNLEQLWTGRLFSQPAGLLALGTVMALVWTLMLGGVLDRFARGGGPLLLAPFLSACGRYFGRLLKLTLLSLPVYWGLYRLSSAVYGWIDERSRDVTAETEVLVESIAAAVPLLLIALVVHALFDFARISAVVDEEPETVRALRNAGRLLLRHPVALPALAVILALPLPLLVTARAGLSIEPTESSWLGILAVFLAGQLFVVVRVALRLFATASQLAFYRAAR